MTLSIMYEAMIPYYNHYVRGVGQRMAFTSYMKFMSDFGVFPKVTFASLHQVFSFIS
jgi:hypothetical protein